MMNDRVPSCDVPMPDAQGGFRLVPMPESSLMFAVLCLVGGAFYPVLFTGRYVMIAHRKFSTEGPLSGVLPEFVIHHFMLLALTATTGMIVWYLPRYRERLASVVGPCLTWLGPILAWIWLSGLWSLDLSATMPSALVLLLATGIGIYLGLSWKPREFLGLVAAVCLVCAIVSLAVCLLTPWGTAPGQEQWAGVFPHRNVFTRVMALGAFTYPFSPLADRWGKGATAAMVGLFLGLMALGGARTEMLALVSAWLLYPVLTSLRLERSLRIPAALVLLVACTAGMSWLALHLETFIGLLGKDLTLTGRIPLWQALWPWLANRPLAGYGFDAFWQPVVNPGVPELWAWVGWEQHHAHNGYIQLLLDVGLVGALLTTAFLVRTGWLALSRLAIDPQDRYAKWSLMVLCFVVVLNIAESVLIQRASLYWMLMVAVFVRMSLDRKESGRYNEA